MSKPPPLPPPLKHPAATLRIKDLSLSVPLLAFALALGGAVLLIRYPEQPPPRVAPAEDVTPAWAVDVRGAALSSVGRVVLGSLPEPLSRQRRPPCDPDLERELRGACWLPVAVDRCPRGKAYVNDEGPLADGRCYARSMQAAPEPTSGEPQRASVAGP